MENKIVFGTRELVSVLLFMICSGIFLNFPRMMAEDSAQAGWIECIVFSVSALIVFFVITKLYAKYEGKDILDISEHIGGGIGRIIVGSIIFIYIGFITSVVLREFTENMKIVSLTISPISFVTGFFIVAMIVGSYYGLEAIARVASVSLPFVILGFFVIIFGVAPEFEFSNLSPVLGLGVWDIFQKGFARISVYAELIYLFLLPTIIKTAKKFNFVGYLSLILSGIFFTLSCVVYQGVFPYPSNTESFLPFYQLARLINLGGFFRRIDPVFVIVWGVSAFLYLTISFFFLIYVFKMTFKIEYLRPLIMPFAIIVFTVSLIPQNLITAIHLATNYISKYGALITFGVPLSVLLIAKFVKKPMKSGVA